MPKQKTYYVCSECGSESPQWFGKCPACGTYNSLEEQLAIQSSTDIPSRGISGWHQQAGNAKPTAKPAKPRASLTFDQISDRQVTRWASGYEELDRVLGGGVVPGSMVLIGGDPGIGKSTLLLQVSSELAQRYRILYVSGEESGQQVKLRASRLGVSKSLSLVSAENDNENGNSETAKETAIQVTQPSEETRDADLYVLPETDLEEILKEMDSLRPNVAIIDSIQTVFFPH